MAEPFQNDRVDRKDLVAPLQAQPHSRSLPLHSQVRISVGCTNGLNRELIQVSPGVSNLTEQHRADEIAQRVPRIERPRSADGVGYPELAGGRPMNPFLVT